MESEDKQKAIEGLAKAKVKLNKPFRTPDGPKKFAVYVKNPQTGRVMIVRFGDPNMEIKKDNPNRRKAYRSRHNCGQADDPTTAEYWSCRSWSDQEDWV
jgi:hypothetical protein